ncbi:MAG TPA: putative zinc-binding metallopeptidase, partial [Mycobacterium sp.]|nr:putative zinc-binding metallopeptidase [Mycobacterium sp.]
MFTSCSSATIEPVRAFACPVCHGFVPFVSSRCDHCHTEIGFDVYTNAMAPVSLGRAVVGERRLIRCARSDSLGCNWLVPEEEEPGDQRRGRCLPDSLVRREPDADDTIALEKLVDTAVALRRLVYQLLDLGLPVDPFWRAEGGLAFDLLSSYSAGERVVIGHGGGVITIDLVESLDAYRETLRVKLGEPYRTILGHFRHEVGHYYQSVLVECEPRYLTECRRLFGDERADYQAAMERHYMFGPPDNWADSYISEYATMHP